MEYSLHRDLKSLYCADPARHEVTIHGYRIDVVTSDEMVEIQHGSLAAIRGKVDDLLKRELRVRIVKPIVARRQLLKRAARGRAIVDRRWSPKRGTILDVFRELIYLRHLFPHPRLILEVPLVEIEEWRFPGHGRRRWRHARDFQIEDQKLTAVGSIHYFRTADDLRELLPPDLPTPFDTRQLASGLKVSQSFAQKIAYCCRHVGAIVTAGKRQNSILYRLLP